SVTRYNTTNVTQCNVIRHSGSGRVTAVLEGIRVLDLTTGIAGPMLGMALADQGAQVTRIETPDDPTRDPRSDRVWNRGKQRAFLNLEDSGDRDVLISL